MEHLFTDFDTANASAWKARLEKDLKGVTFEQLSVADRNGIVIHPFYTNEDIPQALDPLSVQPDWDICARIEVKDAKSANALALNELNNGASGLIFILGEDIDPAELLQDIELPYIYSCFHLGKNASAIGAKFEAYFRFREWDINAMNCFVCHDNIRNFIASGEKINVIDEAFLPSQQVCIDAAIYQNSGATTTYELACSLAHLNEYLNLREETGRASSLKKIQVTLATDTSFFEQIAKLRAFRILSKLIFEAYNIAPQLYLHVETSGIYRSPFDSYSNLLRDTIAGMAAVLGGCNSLYIHPFDETLDQPTAFSRRMSRNQQLIFKEESYLNKVADVAAGSYYLETLTDHIAEQAWTLFKEIEQDGGLLAAFEKGIIEEAIDVQKQQLVQEYKDGKRVLIGVNKFVNANDAPTAKPATGNINKGLKPLLLSHEIL